MGFICWYVGIGVLLYPLFCRLWVLDEGKISKGLYLKLFVFCCLLSPFVIYTVCRWGFFCVIDNVKK